MRTTLNVFSFNNSALSNFKRNEDKSKLSFGINLEKFTNVIPRAAKAIESDLFQRYHVAADFKGSDLIANCVEQTTKIFSEIFGNDFLPQRIGFKSLSSFRPAHKNALGIFSCSESIGLDSRAIYINSDFLCHHNKNLLKIESFIRKFPQNFASTGNMLQTFVHEFAHCAHFSNVWKKGNSFAEIGTIPIPEVNSSIINNYSLGHYAFEDDSVRELIAETLTRQILKYPETILPQNKSTLFNFPDIPDSKGVKYMRAAWDGDMDELRDLSKIIHQESHEKNFERHVTETEYLFAGLGL